MGESLIPEIRFECQYSQNQIIDITALLFK